VEVTLKPQSEGRYQVKDINLLKRPRTTLFGEIVRHKGQPYLRVDRQVSNTDWRLVGDEQWPDGTFAVASIEGGKVVVVRTVDADATGLERVLHRYRIRTGFTPDVEAQARGARRGEETRQDLRDIVTLTIDAPSSRDLDDALAVLPADEQGAMRLLVSIADVDALVPRGGEIDREARRRGTSVYLAGHVIPMLPRALSEDQLSLLPGVDRPALTAELRIDPEGEVTAVDLYPSLIRSNQRLHYRQVGAWLEGRVPDEPIDETLLPTLRWLRTAASRIEMTRRGRGGVSFHNEEAKVSFEDDGHEPVELEALPTNRAHRLVERLMVATNEAVARWLNERGLPALYRVHEEPGREAIEGLTIAARHFGFEGGFGDRLPPRALTAIEEQFSNTPLAPAMYTVLGHALGPARYTVHAAPHFGLAAPLYLHFTSPIRRYADLVVHRVIKAYLTGERGFQTVDQQVEALAQDLNERAFRASRAERERLRMLAARWFAKRGGEQHVGHVVAIRPFGLVVHLEGVGVTGTIELDALGPGQAEIGRYAISVGSQRYHLGASLTVEVTGTDERLGRIDLKPVGGTTTPTG
ncbi:MAG: ribonuclease R family protein, partial [Myxococcota bacterium]